MSVVISSVTPGSPAEKAGLHGGDTLISINDNEIVDVLDYRFYQDVTRPVLKYIDENGKLKKAKIKKSHRALFYLATRYKNAKEICRLFAHTKIFLTSSPR